MNKKRISSGTVHKVPADFRKNLVLTPKALKVWELITPLGRNEWICWIESAKREETRDRRINRACAELVKGKRRPCCWAGCVHR